MSKLAKTFCKRCALYVLFCLLVARVAFADTMSSANYRVQLDSLNVGGNKSASTNYAGTDTVGDVGTGEDLSSTNYKACSGFECFNGKPYLTFSVREGTATPGTDGAGVPLGSLNPDAIVTSDGSSINSIFVNATGSAVGGLSVKVKDANSGLLLPSSSFLIPSASTTLSPGAMGYGICVFSTGQSQDSPSMLDPASPYDGTCTRNSGNQVGALSTSPQTLLHSSGPVIDGSAEVLVKAAVSSTVPAGAGYVDTLTMIITSTF